MRKLFQLIDKYIRFIEDVMCTVSFSVIICVTIAQVFYRYVLRSGILWGDELVQILMVVMAMFASARAVRTNGHTDLQGLTNSLPKSARTVMRISVSILTMVFLVLFAVSAYQHTVSAGKLVTVIMRIPGRVCYASMPIGAVLMLYEFIKKLKYRVFQEPISND